MKRLWTSALFLLIGFAAGLGVMRSQQPAAQTQRFPQFENDNVRVWRSLVLPDSPLTLHRHDHGRVIIPLQGGTMNIVQQNGPTESHIWEVGKAYWLPANPPGTMHADVNAGTKPIEVMVVELKNDK
jgi:beta-alanine degradation protein BauB